MPREDSPSIGSFSEGVPEPAPQPVSRRKRLWSIMAILALLALLLLAGNLIRGHSFTTQSGSGNVIGQVVEDHSNQPIQADVFLFGSKTILKSGLDGHFELYNLPAGTQDLVVTYQGGAREFPILIKKGVVLDIGVIRMSATAEP